MNGPIIKLQDVEKIASYPQTVILASHADKIGNRISMFMKLFKVEENWTSEYYVSASPSPPIPYNSLSEAVDAYNDLSKKAEKETTKMVSVKKIDNTAAKTEKKVDMMALFQSMKKSK